MRKSFMSFAAAMTYSLDTYADLTLAHPVTDIREVDSLILDSLFRAVLS